MIDFIIRYTTTVIQDLKPLKKLPEEIWVFGMADVSYNNDNYIGYNML